MIPLPEVGMSHRVMLPLLLLLASRASAQAVRLRITDFESEAPVPDAVVAALGDHVVVRSDSAGYARIAVGHPGSVVLTVRRLGFEPVVTTLDVPTRDTLRAHVILKQAAVRIDAMHVSVEGRAVATLGVSGFEDRRLHNAGGHFFGPADIERADLMYLVDLFRGIPGLRVRGDSLFSSRGTFNAGKSVTECRVAVGIDGAVYGTDFDLNVVSPRDVHGVEIYAGGATIPPQYLTTSGGACGLVMIWTRTGGG